MLLPEWHVGTLAKHVSCRCDLALCILRGFVTVVDASLGEILTTCSKMEWLLDYGEAALRTETRHSNLIMSYKKSIVYHEPLGVVGALVSWNYRSYRF
jgi:acyl-CoA reductase-like NAD-dependent aldehyde dehydrogenase